MNKGLKGILITTHNNSASWFDELALSAPFRRDAALYCKDKEADVLANKLASCKNDDLKEKLIRVNYPPTFVAFLKDFGRTEEL